jgi:hypothetical protein
MSALRGDRAFLRDTMTQEEAKVIVRERLAQRETNFLRLIEKGVFGYPRSPYLPLFGLARANYGDVQNMEQQQGLDDTRRALRKAGVYVSFEEFKGRQPMVRDGTVIERSVVQTVLDALGQGSPAADIARATWSQANILRVRRMEPIWTDRGRLRPLHLRTKGGT